MVLFTLACVGVGVWHQYKMYHWHREIPTIPLHQESHYGIFPESVQVIFDRAYVSEKTEESSLAREKFATAEQSSKKSTEYSREQLENCDRLQPHDDFDALCESAYTLMESFDESGFHWLVDQYPQANARQQTQIRRIVFGDFGYLPGSWVHGEEAIKKVLWDQLRESNSQSLSAARIIERADLSEMSEDLYQLAYSRKHRLEQNLGLFRSEPVGELMRVVCSIKADKESLERLKRMVSEKWQNDPRIGGGTTPAKEYDTLVKSLYWLTLSKDDHVVKETKQYIQRLGLESKFIAHADRQADLNAIQLRLRRLYDNHLRTDASADFDKLFSVVEARSRYLRFRSTTDNLLLAYTQSLLLNEGRPLQWMEIDQLETQWLFLDLMNDECEIVVSDRVFKFDFGALRTLPFVDVLNQILERQRSRHRIAVFGEGKVFAFVCDKAMYETLSVDLKLRFTDATNAVFKKLKK
jgi:hypothetical protein